VPSLTSPGAKHFSMASFITRVATQSETAFSLGCETCPSKVSFKTPYRAGMTVVQACAGMDVPYRVKESVHLVVNGQTTGDTTPQQASSGPNTENGNCEGPCQLQGDLLLAETEIVAKLHASGVDIIHKVITQES
jgi:hypothetical protein